MRRDVLVNGSGVDQVAVADRGLHYGDGLFETLAVLDGQPRLWQRHVTRLREGCARLGIAMPDPSILYDEARALCREHARAVLKIIVTRGAGGRGYRPPIRAQHSAPTRIVAVYPWPDYPAAYAEEGIALRVCRTRLGCNPALAGMKHLNRLEQVLARAEWDDPAIAEGLMLDQRERVIAGTMSNLFLVREGRLLTPRLDECGVAGIMRGLILESAVQQGIAVEIGDLSLECLRLADEIFVSNSVAGLWPVRRLAQMTYAVGPLTSALRTGLMAVQRQEMADSADSSNG